MTELVIERETDDRRNVRFEIQRAIRGVKTVEKREVRLRETERLAAEIMAKEKRDCRACERFLTMSSHARPIMFTMHADIL